MEDFTYFLPISSRMDVYCQPSKRVRTNFRIPFDRNDFEEEGKNPSIDDLPDECLFEIFKRLQSGKSRSSCACVSKRWLMLLSSIRRDNEDRGDQELENNGYLTRHLEGKKATDIRLAAIAIGSINHGGLGKLSVKGMNSICRVTNVGLTSIAYGCSTLRALSLWNIASISDEGLLEIAKECHLLEKFDICQCPLISNRALIAIAEGCSNLTVLSIESCPNIGNEGLQAIGRSCPKLESISIKDCSLIGDCGVSSLISSACSSLHKVKLQALNITDFSLAVIGHYGKVLTHLTLCSLKNVSEKGFWVMGNAQALKLLISLTITSCQGVTDVSLGAIGNGCKSLKQMCFRKCSFISDDGLQAFSKATRTLEVLQLDDCNRITISGIIGSLTNHESNLKSLVLVKCSGIKDTTLQSPLLSCGSSLRWLSIRNCTGFGAASLALVGRLCPQLQHLDLVGLYSLTDAVLLPLLESCEGLVKVNLSGCLNLTDESIHTLARLHGATLQLVNLDGCRKITDQSLVAIADNLLVLNELDVSNCAVSDCGLIALSLARHTNLLILSLAGCCGITSRSLPSLERLGKTLVGLNLKGCNSISSSSIEVLVENLWRCDILL
ncbi:EIN3-binding F-box protein 1-like isoform X2 [Benincasa hispida]|nr:EIN3-binding F-box protein 1-like isoform X2 [Benincasa hispida]